VFIVVFIVEVCVCLLLQDLVQSCWRGEGGIWEDMWYERRRAEACVDEAAHHAVLKCVCLLLLQDLVQSCLRGGWSNNGNPLETDAGAVS
jgi:hypothetical protein